MKAPNTTQCSEALVRHSAFCAEPLQRPHFFDGRFLTAQDLAAEQNYLRKKHRQHNLHCHGVGVVSGLKISTTNEKRGATIIIEPGIAIDPSGNELHLCAPARLPLPKSPSAIQVGIHLVERFTGSIPVGISGESGTQPSHVEEGCEIVLEALPPTSPSSAKPCPDANVANGLPLARLTQKRGAWGLDRRFKVPRSR
jgi:hypothetical protein